MARKAREPRRDTVTPARVNSGGEWQDACILNISSSGMMLQAGKPPPRGHYLEVRRGSYVMIGRVVWSKDYYCGVQLQDPLKVDQIVAEVRSIRRAPADDGMLPERRRIPRPEVERHERSRWVSRAVEHGAFAIAGATAAVLVMQGVGAALAQPLQHVEAALGGPSAR